jgi:hypothetical protein
MRKTTIASIVVVAVLGVAAWIVLAKPFSPGAQKVDSLSRKWMEDLQFKDFRASSLYHHELDRGRVDIGRTLERLFLVKPEMLDIIDYRIVKTEVDSSGRRARVKVEARYKRLNKDKKPQEADLMLYWMKRHPDCPIGATCPDGTCVNEFGEPVEKTEEDEQSRRDGTDAPEPVEGKAEDTYTCDTSAERAWFMNLDSTLKEKPYQRN